MEQIFKNIYGDLPLVVLIAGAVMVGLWVSNVVYDRGVPNYISRKIGHGAGGLAFLASFVLASAWWPIIISTGFTLLLLTAHFIRPKAVRGVGGSGRSERILAEVWFPLVAVPVYAIAWLWLKHPEAAVACLLFMAWGDGVTGLVRAQGLWGSVADAGSVSLHIVGVSTAFLDRRGGFRPGDGDRVVFRRIRYF